MFVSIFLPGSDFLGQGRLIGNSSIEALAGKHAEFGFGHVEPAHEAIPGSRLEIIEGAGHFPHVETPKKFLDVLIDFLETTEPAHFGAADLQHLLRQRAMD